MSKFVSFVCLTLALAGCNGCSDSETSPTQTDATTDVAADVTPEATVDAQVATDVSDAAAPVCGDAALDAVPGC
jgi:hypothetical protein